MIGLSWGSIDHLECRRYANVNGGSFYDDGI
jgi:hypothetical protein